MRPAVEILRDVLLDGLAEFGLERGLFQAGDELVVVRRTPEDGMVVQTVG